MKLLLIIMCIISILPVQAPLFDNDIEEYGNASMMNNGLPGCVTWLAKDIRQGIYLVQR